MTNTKREDVRKAIREAEEFVRRAKAVALEYDANSERSPVRGYSAVDGRLTGAMKRQSMELTRALADLRRSR